MIQEIGPAEGGQGGVKRVKEIFIEVINPVPPGQGFPHRVSGEQEDAASGACIPGV
jgi:hypothetical protein